MQWPDSRGGGRGIGVLTVELDPAQKRVTQFFFEKMLDRTSAIIASRRPEIYGGIGGN